jgi:hypothetical protein
MTVTTEEVVESIRRQPGGRVVSGPFITAPCMRPTRAVLWYVDDESYPQLAVHTETAGDDGVALHRGEYFGTTPGEVADALLAYHQRVIEHVNGTLPAVARDVRCELLKDVPFEEVR